MSWNEDDHPRDENGQFTDKDGFYRQNSLEHYNRNHPNYSALTTTEWALWYKALAKMKRKNEFPSGNNRAYVAIGNKIVITSGTFENPTAFILCFKKESEAKKYLCKMKSKMKK